MWVSLQFITQSVIVFKKWVFVFFTWLRHLTSTILGIFQLELALTHASKRVRTKYASENCPLCSYSDCSVLQFAYSGTQSYAYCENTLFLLFGPSHLQCMGVYVRLSARERESVYAKGLHRSTI